MDRPTPAELRRLRQALAQAERDHTAARQAAEDLRQRAALLEATARTPLDAARVAVERAEDLQYLAGLPPELVAALRLETPSYGARRDLMRRLLWASSYYGSGSYTPRGLRLRALLLEAEGQGGGG